MSYRSLSERRLPKGELHGSVATERIGHHVDLSQPEFLKYDGQLAADIEQINLVVA